MKYGPVNKLEKRNTKTSKKLNGSAMLGNCDVIVIFSNLWPIWSNSEAGIQKFGL